jgi:hypothetical protein
MIQCNVLYYKNHELVPGGPAGWKGCLLPAGRKQAGVCGRVVTCSHAATISGAAGA